MGDRANIRFKQENASIYLYTHWAGHELPDYLREALEKARDRWDDEPYGTRVIIQSVLSNASDEVTGWGLTTYPTDNEHDVMEVDFSVQKIRKRSRKGFTDRPQSEWENNAEVKEEWTFDEYCSVPELNEVR